MTEIKPYILTKSSNGLSLYNYLIIRGGVGHGKKHLGGTYKFVVSYMSVFDEEERDSISLEKFCQQKGITFGGGDTIELAYADYKSKNPSPIQ